jgi:dATP pyrophosphohydrolase
MEVKKKVQVYLFRRRRNCAVEFLLLKRAQELRGFWQPVTGTVEEGEIPRQAARREVREETGLEKFHRVVGPVYSFTFVKNCIEFHEEVYGAEIGEAEITLSSEHTEYRWVSLKEALELLLYVQNKRGLSRLEKQLRRDGIG